MTVKLKLDGLPPATVSKKSLDRLVAACKEAEAPKKVVDHKSKAYKLQRELRMLKIFSMTTIGHIENFIMHMDDEMKQPSNNERGKRIARLIGSLEMSKDLLKHHLGMPLKRKGT